MQKILTAIVKAGLKALVPLVGDLTVEVAQAGVEQLLDAHEKAAADDIASRLLQRLQTAVSAWQASERVDAGAVESALTMAKQIASQSQRFLARWADAEFDASRAAQEAIAAANEPAGRLGDAERRACLAVLTALFEGLASERAALQATEADFRRQVLAGMASLTSAARNIPQAQGDWLIRAAASAALSLPVQRWALETSAPGALLRADLDDPVPFHGRQSELQDLEAWCATGATVRVRVYAGRGGVGKTRLLRELVRRVERRAWRAGFLDPAIGDPGPRFWDTFANGGEACLVVLDYAETRREEIIGLARALAPRLDRTGAAPRRVVLIARAADEWLDQLRGESHGVGDLLRAPLGSVHKLGAVADSLDRRQESFGIASRHFAGKVRQPAPPVPEAATFEGEECETTLLLHIAALAAVEGVQVKGDQGILDYILGRERRFWRERAASAGLEGSLVRGVGRMMAAVTLIGGVESRSQALGLLDRIGFFADQPTAVREQLAHLLHEIYPGDHWIEPLLPDLLGEHLCQEELHDEAISSEIYSIVFDSTE